MVYLFGHLWNKVIYFMVNPVFLTSDYSDVLVVSFKSELLVGDCITLAMGLLG